MKNLPAMMNMIIGKYVAMLTIISGHYASTAGVKNFIVFYLDGNSCYIQAVCTYVPYRVIFENTVIDGGISPT